MRIITGKYGGRRLKSVSGKKTRPTADKIKEAVFQMIGPYFSGGTCLDLFAGSGALGIEAISRGIDKAIFIDKQAAAIHTIKENINTLNIGPQTSVLKMDANKALKVLANKNECFNLILIDPPYEKVNIEEIVEKLLIDNLIAEGGIIYCEHDVSETLPECIGELEKVKQSKYSGTTKVTIYEKR